MKSTIVATQAPGVNVGLTALQDWAGRTAAVGSALANLHERRTSNAYTRGFLWSRHLTISHPLKLRLLLGSSRGDKLHGRSRHIGGGAECRIWDERGVPSIRK
jgi:hypothetical protein